MKLFGNFKLGASIKDSFLFKVRWKQTKKTDYSQHTLLHTTSSALYLKLSYENLIKDLI